MQESEPRNQKRRMNYGDLLTSALRVSLASMLLSLGIVALLVSYYQSWRPNHFTYLASALNQGTFTVDNLPPDYPDWVSSNGHIYIPLGPMPGILLMPLVGLVGRDFQENFAALAFTLVNMLIMLRILRQIGIFDSGHVKWLISLFFFGTVYFSALAVGRSWYLAHVVAVMFTLLLIHEALGQNRAFFMGVWWGAAFLTRASLLFSLPFLLWSLLRHAKDRDRPLEWSIRQIALLVVGTGGPLLFFAWYNFARFGNVFDTGYAHAVLGAPVLDEAIKYGLFSLVHIPKNLYMLLLAPPLPYPSFNAPILQFPFISPSPWGMGLFFTTPAFAYVFWSDFRSSLVRIAALTAVSLLVPLTTYYGIGWAQFGYRYALDFYPYLFIPTALGISSKFNHTAQALILISLVINLLGALWLL